MGEFEIVEFTVIFAYVVDAKQQMMVLVVLLSALFFGSGGNVL